MTQCYKTHPAMPLPVGHKYKRDAYIYGGSCLHPMIQDADIYVGLERNMAYAEMAYPWTQGMAISYLIPDYKEPQDYESFAELIGYLRTLLLTDYKIHVGCIGGHGRTGTVLAALCRVMTGEKDAIRYVREHYCRHAVESRVQVDFLQEHYDILPAPVEDGTTYVFPKQHTLNKFW